MLKTNSSRTVRSNSLNVPDGTVALSIQIPDPGALRKSSVCSCSKCSWASEADRPMSAMTSSTDFDSISQVSYTRPQSECYLNNFNNNHSATTRSASVDFAQPSAPPTPRSRSKSSIGTRPSIDDTIGQISFKLFYNLEMGSLDVHVIECRDLPHFGKHNPNPLVYVSLLPDDGYLEHSKVKTKCRKNSYNPTFGEVIKFPNLTKFELDDRSVFFQVFHLDPFSKKSIIGEAEIRVEDYPWATEEPVWMPLRKQTLGKESPDQIQINSRRGILNFDISFKIKDEKTQKGDIHFFVKNGSNLTGDPPILCKSPFVKINLLWNRKIINSARTSAAEFQGNGLQPFWNYDLVIQNQSIEKLKKRALEVSVWDRENSINSRYIGRLLFCLSDPKKPEKTTQSLWRRLMETPEAKFNAELQLQP
ncbi:hypothetical protein FO519_004442 [Halicephalobus sp. NKZ332]|nr:hypothetical protein FO519_004442 [Halicephalobus sp. NKZ332]